MYAAIFFFIRHTVFHYVFAVRVYRKKLSLSLFRRPPPVKRSSRKKTVSVVVVPNLTQPNLTADGRFTTIYFGGRKTKPIMLSRDDSTIDTPPTERWFPGEFHETFENRVEFQKWSRVCVSHVYQTRVLQIRDISLCHNRWDNFSRLVRGWTRFAGHCDLRDPFKHASRRREKRVEMQSRRVVFAVLSISILTKAAITSGRLHSTDRF